MSITRLNINATVSNHSMIPADKPKKLLAKKTLVTKVVSPIIFA